jgi:hypothetical protein
MCSRKPGANRDLCIALWFLVVLFGTWLVVALYMMSWYAGSLN